MSSAPDTAWPHGWGRRPLQHPKERWIAGGPLPGPGRRHPRGRAVSFPVCLQAQRVLGTRHPLGAHVCGRVDDRRVAPGKPRHCPLPFPVAREDRGVLCHKALNWGATLPSGTRLR